MIGASTPEATGMFFNRPVVGGTGQIVGRGGYPAEHHQMTTDEHRLWNLKLQADMIGRAALKAMNRGRSNTKDKLRHYRQLEEPSRAVIIGLMMPLLGPQQG